MKNIFPLLILLLLFSCSPSKENNTPNTTFQIDPNQRNIVQGSQGGILIIPANSFVNEQGQIITESIEVHLTEAYQLKDIINHNLQTVADDQLLVTGGMINLEATAANNPVQIASDKEITYQKGISTTDTNAYQFFTMEDENWGNSQSPNPYLTYLPTSEQSSLFVYYTDNPTDTFFTNESKINKEDIYWGGDECHIDSVLQGYGQYLYGLEKITYDKNLVDHSFLASQEFSERVKTLPPCGELNSNIYIIYLKNLDKPLWIADSLAIKEVKKYMGYYLKDTTDSRSIPPYYYLQLKLLSAFKNQRKTTFREDRLTVEERTELQAFYEKLKTEETKSNTMYSFSIRSTGWHNIDYYYKKVPLLPTQLTIAANETIEKSILILKDVPVVVYGIKQQDGSFVFDQNLPHTKAYLVSIGFKGEQILLSKKEITIGQNKTETITLESSTKQKMEQMLQSIEQGFDLAN